MPTADRCLPRVVSAAPTPVPPALPPIDNPFEQACFFDGRQLQLIDKWACRLISSSCPVFLTHKERQRGALRDRPQPAGTLPATEAEGVGGFRRPVHGPGDPRGQPYGGGPQHPPFGRRSGRPLRGGFSGDDQNDFAGAAGFSRPQQPGDVPDGRRPADRGQGVVGADVGGAAGQRRSRTRRQGVPDPHPSIEERLANQEEVQRLLRGLEGTEAQVVRMYHLEGKSYHEISQVVGMPENSIGPILSRAGTACPAGVDSAAG